MRGPMSVIRFARGEFTVKFGGRGHRRACWRQDTATNAPERTSAIGIAAQNAPRQESRHLGWVFALKAIKLFTLQIDRSN